MQGGESNFVLKRDGYRNALVFSLMINRAIHEYVATMIVRHRVIIDMALSLMNCVEPNENNTSIFFLRC